MKISPLAIIQAHRRTYIDARTGRRMKRDVVLFEILPLIAAVACLPLKVQINQVAAAALLTVSGLLGALLFAAMLLVSQRAMDWSDTQPQPGPDTTQHAEFLGEIAANSGYATLVCIAASGGYFAATVASGWLLTIASAISVGLTLHLLVVLLLVIRRVFALTQERLNRARTGADLPDRGSVHRRAG